MSTPATSAAGASSSPSAVNLRTLLEEMIERDASDLHITAGERPKLRCTLLSTVQRLRLSDRLFSAQRDYCVQSRVQALDALQRREHDLFG